MAAMQRNLIAMAMLATTSALALAPKPVPFGPGEQSLYEVTFLGVPAGIVQITVGLRTEQYGARVLPLVCVGQTTSIASIFQIKDRFVSYFDPEAMKPVGADQFIDENRSRRRDRFRFNQEPLKAHANKKKEGQGAYDVSYDVPEGTMDLAAAAFWLRGQSLTVGQTLEVPIFTGAKWYPMHIGIEGRETLATRLGELPVFRVSISTDFQGSAATKGNILVYYTADERQLPVRVKADFVVGSTTADIVQYLPGSPAL
jgi:hypothetical protein